jgi:hypothetical protein
VRQPKYLNGRSAHAGDLVISPKDSNPLPTTKKKVIGILVALSHGKELREDEDIWLGEIIPLAKMYADETWRHAWSPDTEYVVIQESLLLVADITKQSTT